MVRQGEAMFGAPLLQMERGRGSRLTPLGEKLVWADRRIAARRGDAILDAFAHRVFERVHGWIVDGDDGDVAVATQIDWIGQGRFPGGFR